MVGALAGSAFSQAISTAPYLTIEMSGAFLVADPTVKHDLGLTTEQSTRIAGIFATYGERQQAASNTASTDPKAYERIDIDTANSILSVLTSAQKQRLSEVTLQLVGVSAIGSPEVAKRLGLTQDQKAKAQAILLAVDKKEEDLDAELADSIQKLQEPNSESQRVAYEKEKNRIAAAQKPKRDAISKERKQAELRVLDLLSSGQRAKWENMLGKPLRHKGAL